MDEVMIFGDEACALSGAGVTVDFDVLLDELAVEVDADEAGLFEDSSVFG